MKSERSWRRDSLLTGGLLVGLALFVVSLPLLAVVVIFARTVGIALIASALVGGFAAYAVSPRFREWLQRSVDTDLKYKGVNLESRVGVYPGHTWARFGRGPRAGIARVGTDDMVQAVLGPVEAIDAPAPGTRIQRGDPLFKLRRGRRTVSLASPVSGTVGEINQTVQSDPGRINDDPYGEGWVLKLQSDDPLLDRQRLMRGERGQRWFRNEVDHLLGVLLGDQAPVQAAADGGSIVENLYEHIDDEAWNRLSHQFFGGLIESQAATEDSDRS